MNEKSENKINLDILQHVETLSNKLNEVMASRTRSAFRRYPLTFALLILAGVIIVSEGVKGILRSLGLFDFNPWILLIIGILILAITGKLYKKLDNEK